MAKWGILPSRWDKLSKYDRAFMMQFVNTEADVDAVAMERTGKSSTFVVGPAAGEAIDA